MKQNKIKKIILLSLILITGISCAKKKKDNTPLVLGLVLLNQSQQAKAEVFPTCKLTSRFSGSGTATVLNVPLTVATSVQQNFRTQGFEIVSGFSFFHYAMIRVTAKVNGKLTFQGTGSTFSPKFYADNATCDINFDATSLTVATSNLGIGGPTILTFSQAGTYLAPTQIFLNSDDPAVFVKYND